MEPVPSSGTLVLIFVLFVCFLILVAGLQCLHEGCWGLCLLLMVWKHERESFHFCLTNTQCGSTSPNIYLERWVCVWNCGTAWPSLVTVFAEWRNYWANYCSSSHVLTGKPSLLDFKNKWRDIQNGVLVTRSMIPCSRKASWPQASTLETGHVWSGDIHMLLTTPLSWH